MIHGFVGVEREFLVEKAQFKLCLYFLTLSVPALDSFWATLNDSFDVVVGLVFLLRFKAIEKFSGGGLWVLAL